MESISQKYDEIAQNLGKIAQLNYYSSEKAAHSMENGYSSAATVISGLKGPLSTLGGGVMNSAQSSLKQMNIGVRNLPSFTIILRDRCMT